MDSALNGGSTVTRILRCWRKPSASKSSWRAHSNRYQAGGSIRGAGQATIENIDTLFEFMLKEGIAEEKIPDEIGKFLASGAADKLFALFAKNHTAYTPAISQFQWSLQAADASVPKDPGCATSPSPSATSSRSILLQPVTCEPW